MHIQYQRNGRNINVDSFLLKCPSMFNIVVQYSFCGLITSDKPMKTSSTNEQVIALTVTHNIGSQYHLL